ncbi:MAG TPA: glycoside hydrolase family 38 C-terminal domain-containing protein [Ktedonobacteraceae bacterium]|nr:glycoside hydrolase family 38 C-terminal domain-containing protein [Ktedonobacteraceae bacterium]
MTEQGKQLHIILVPHTHWDREWYQTFQQFRVRLVRTIDKLLDILERDSNFSYFMLDGQTIVLDDYLEVQPEQEARLKKYARAGRISVGPWYTQPDEFLVSGESLIRNLQFGMQRAAEFGEPMRTGYVPDCFGHIAQLPQILQGFGIDNAVFWRGVGAEAKKSEFFWAAPDGTRVLVIHLADPLGYSNARKMPLAPDEFVARVEFLSAQLLPKATTNTLLFMNGSDHLEPQDGLPETITAANALLAHINPEHEKIIAKLGHTAQNGSNTHFDGIHVQIGTLPQYIETVRRQNGCETQDGQDELQVLTGEMRSSQYSHLLPAVLSSRVWIKQQNNATEHLLEHWVEPLTAWAWKLGATYPAGLIRVAWKYLLQNHPHDSICGCSVDQVHHENAVRFAQSQQVAESIITQAMQSIAETVNTRAPVRTTDTGNQPIPIVVFNPAPGPRADIAQAVISFPGTLRNAVIIDEQGQHVPFTVVNRWRQELGSTQLARETTAAAVSLMGANAPGEFIRLAENTAAMMLGQPEGAYEIIRLHIDTDQQPEVAHIEVIIAPRENVTTKDHDLLAAEQQIREILQREDIHSLNVTAIDQVRETLEFVACDLPAYGFKTFWVYPRGSKAEVNHANQVPASALSSQEHWIENEWYRVEASAADGTLTITDKDTGAIFTGLNRFVDGGDVGDLYNYCPPAEDVLVSQPIEPPKIELHSAGPARAVLRVTGRWSLPVACAANRAERSARASVCHIVSDIALSPGVQRIDIHTSIDNKVRDHRLRVIFPVPLQVEHVSAEGTFEVRARPLTAARPEHDDDWIEEPVNTFPQKRFVDVSDGTTGLALLNRGLPECEILQDGPGVEVGQVAVALTLLRCVEWLSRGDLPNRHGHAGPMEHTPEGQCPGHQEFDYAIVPHSGDWRAEEARILREAQAFNVPVRTIVAPLSHRGTTGSREHKGGQAFENAQQREKLLPSRVTFIEVEPRELVVSAIKRENSGKGLIVRVYNPLLHAVEASLRPGFASSRACVTNLLEEEQEQLFWSGETGEPLHVDIRAGEIKTILFQ